MLIHNKSTVEKIVHLHLIYDDGSIKRGRVKKNTLMYITFRRDGRVVEAYGKVTDIVSSYHHAMEHSKNNTCIVFNTSKRFRSKEYIINIDDIIDFTLIPPVTHVGPEKGRMPMKVLPDVERKEHRHDKEAKTRCRKISI